VKVVETENLPVSALEARLANKWHRMLPTRTLDLILRNRLPVGCRLVGLRSELAAPGAEEWFGGHMYGFESFVYLNVC